MGNVPGWPGSWVLAGSSGVPPACSLTRPSSPGRAAKPSGRSRIA